MKYEFDISIGVLQFFVICRNDGRYVVDVTPPGTRLGVFDTPTKLAHAILEHVSDVIEELGAPGTQDIFWKLTAAENKVKGEL